MVVYAQTCEKRRRTWFRIEFGGTRRRFVEVELDNTSGERACVHRLRLMSSVQFAREVGQCDVGRNGQREREMDVQVEAKASSLQRPTQENTSLNLAQS